MSVLTFTLHTPEDLVPCQQLPHARRPHYAAFMMPTTETKRRLRNTQDINQKTTRPKKLLRSTQVAWHHSSFQWQATTLGSPGILSSECFQRQEESAVSFVATLSAHPSQDIHSKKKKKEKKTQTSASVSRHSREGGCGWKTGIGSINSASRLKVQLYRDAHVVLLAAHHVDDGAVDATEPEKNMPPLIQPTRVANNQVQLAFLCICI